MQGKTLIRILAHADGSACPLAGQYVKSCDFEAHGGRGELVTTRDPDEALKFADAAAAMLFWKRRSQRRPTRPDGKPNRPLTAYTCDIGPAH